VVLAAQVLKRVLEVFDMLLFAISEGALRCSILGSAALRKRVSAAITMARMSPVITTFMFDMVSFFRQGRTPPPPISVIR
jgi:hypothetical protein